MAKISLPFRQGFTLLEVLIALLVLSIGLLGAAGMQWHALKAHHETGHAIAGMRYALELATKIRAHRASWQLYPQPYQLQWQASEGASLPAVNCFQTRCTDPAILARWDLTEVLYQLAQDMGLPGAQLVICQDQLPTQAGSLDWSCSGTGPLVIKLGWLQQPFKLASKTVQSGAPQGLPQVRPIIGLLVGAL